MDKYTVDLDKVLNDFEYSELTEQNNGYSTNGASNASYNSPSEKVRTQRYSYDTLPYQQQTYPKASNTTTKHSINNVFHSLNEYLNSDIRTDIQKPSQTLSEINEIQANIPTYIQKTEADSIQDIFKSTVTEGEKDNSVYSGLPAYSFDLNDENIEDPTTAYEYTSSTISDNIQGHSETKSNNFKSNLKDESVIDSNYNLGYPKSNHKYPDVNFKNLKADLKEKDYRLVYPNPNLIDNITVDSNPTLAFPKPILNYPDPHLSNLTPSLLDKDLNSSACYPEPILQPKDNQSNSKNNGEGDKSVDLDQKQFIDNPVPNLKNLEPTLVDTNSSILCPILKLDSIYESGENKNVHIPTLMESNSDLVHPIKDTAELESHLKANNSKSIVGDLKSDFENDMSSCSEPNLTSLRDKDLPTFAEAMASIDFLEPNITMSEFAKKNTENLKSTDSNVTALNSGQVDTNSTQIPSELPADVKVNLEQSTSELVIPFSELKIHNEFSNNSVLKKCENNQISKELNEKDKILEKMDKDNKNVLKRSEENYLEHLSLDEDVKEESVRKIIGFGEEPDISDTDMENELAQLEEEYNEKIDNEARLLESEIEEIENNVNCKLDDKPLVKNGTSINNNQITENKCIEKNSIMEKTKNETVKEMVEETLEGLKKEDIVNSFDEPNDSIKDNANNIVNNSLADKCVIKENEEMVCKEDGEAEETEIELEKEKLLEKDVNTKGKQFSLLRPNSLDISSESQVENTPINLIGDPGSTPYNNIYMQNSLETNNPMPTTDAARAENEANNSLSPTISEVSTSETSDSPNTSDSCNDTSLDDNLNDSLGKSSKRGNGETNGAESEVKEEEASGTQTRAGGDEPGNISGVWLGKTAPFWTPDSDTLSCLQCLTKFTLIKRRHHCRACGLVLCSRCCSMKYKLEYMDNAEARVCALCFEVLGRGQGAVTGSSGSDGSQESQGGSPVAGLARPLNPGNPMDYCSQVPPLEQVGNLAVGPPSVMVPVGVLKRKGSAKSRIGKSVMFCDGIRPGCDLTELDNKEPLNYKDMVHPQLKSLRVKATQEKMNRNAPKLDAKTQSFIPSEELSLPSTVNVVKSEISYSDCANNHSVVEMLKNEMLTFALQKNLHVYVRIINMDCCINKFAWCFSTDGMISVGQDEIVILLEMMDNEKLVPKDMFLHLNNIYLDAVKGTSITEMGLSIHNTSNFLESKNHAGFLYIKPTFQCVQNVIVPKEPYLIGILIHRWETPWAKIFPLRLLLRLGAEYRYYPSPIISSRHRESVYVEIGHTIINLLADFRNFSYTLPNVRGLTIHMEEKNTTVSIPTNRYDQVMKALNNSSDHILAFAANFSPNADSHLVCIQDTHGNNENAYTTHAINIHNKPRKEFRSCEPKEDSNFNLTGASFIVLNGALKSTSGLTAKSSIVEDGLMIQILPEQMVKLRSSLRNMKDFKIYCGCVNAQSDEFVNICWTENDVNFNVGVVSPIDSMSLSGIPSIRVHNGRDYICNSRNKMIRWTQVFIIESGDENNRSQEPVDIGKLSESISKATSQALVKYLDLLATNSFIKIGIRTTLHVDNVSYLAGSNGVKLPPIYMKSLDNELIPILHKITSNNLGETSIVIELIFHILSM